MQDLIVGIGDSAESLENCLHRFFKVEKLKRYACTVCDEKVKAQKSYFIEEPPNVLTITLKRFLNSGEKLDHPISYPMELDMTHFIHSSNGDNVYDLCALVIHVGTIVAGHYICYVKNYLGNWSLFDDRMGTTVPAKDVQEKQAYMLLYIRRTILPKPLPLEVSMEQKREQTGITPASFPWQGNAIPPFKIRQEESTMYPPNHIMDTDDVRSGYRTILRHRAGHGEVNENRRTLSNSDLDLKEEDKKRLRETYWIAEDTEKEVVLKNIRIALDHYDRTAHFSLPSRGKDSDVFDVDLQHLCQANKGQYQSRSETKEKRIADVMKIVRDHLESGMLIQQRTIYYMNAELYGLRSSNSDDIVTAVCNILKCTRTSLNVTVSSGGSIAGPVILHIMGGIIVDCWRCGTAGCKIPDEAYHIASIETVRKVRFILIVEKETVFRMLTGIKLHDRYNCIIITGSGQPDLATRFVVWVLRRVLGVPVYAFVDANSFGIRIVCTYKFGSERRSSDNIKLACPDINWVGLYSSDVKPIPTPQHLTAKNAAKLVKKAETEKNMLVNLLKLKHVHEAGWAPRIKNMLDSGKTGDIERSVGLKDMEGFLVERISEMEGHFNIDYIEARRQRQVDNTDDKIEYSSCKLAVIGNTRSKLDSDREDEGFLAKEEDLPSLAKKTNGQVSKELKPENVASDDETKKKSSNVRKRKSDIINQDPVSQVDEAELKKKSKKKKRTLLEAKDGKHSNNIRTLENGLVIEDMSKVAFIGSKVYIHYVGTLGDGTIVHSNLNEKPYKFTLGSDKVIRGWNLGIDGMHVGDKRRLTVPPSMGENGGKTVEAHTNSTITYEVELVKVR